MSETNSGPHRMQWPLATGLALSGLAGLINQVAWERALKIYLGGSETISAMTIVVVFMLGLGLGSLYSSWRAGNLANPLKFLAGIELLLAIFNSVVAGLLGLELSTHIYACQRLAVACAAPLRLVYGLSAFVILIFPCFLMGMTMPIAAEACQRQLGCQRKETLDWLFVLNTVGACLGALLAGFYLLPRFGQRESMFSASLSNVLAAVSFFWLSRRVVRTETPVLLATKSIGSIRQAWRQAVSEPLATEEMLGLLLGFVSLAYEMYLFRAISLAHEPLPFTFAIILVYYLAFWSVGVLLATWIQEHLDMHLIMVAGLIGFMPFVAGYDRWIAPGFSFVGMAVIYFLPCLWFGLLFGMLVARLSRRSWGWGVGRFYGLNTVGCCLGILLTTFLGYELGHDFNAWLLANILLLLALYAGRTLASGLVTQIPRSAIRCAGTVLGISLLCLLYTGFHTPIQSKPGFSYFGRDGVIDVNSRGALSWDGLWHSALSRDGDHVGTANWKLAIIPLLCHNSEVPIDTLVIGLGTGITAATLAQCNWVRSVEVYDINHTLQQILRDFPQGTLRVAENPKVKLKWQDGRSGLAPR